MKHKGKSSSEKVFSPKCQKMIMPSCLLLSYCEYTRVEDVQPAWKKARGTVETLKPWQYRNTKEENYGTSLTLSYL